MDSLWLVAVLLGDGAINWIDVPEYEVHFHIVAALVRSKHDGIGCLVIELRVNRFGFGGCLRCMFFGVQASVIYEGIGPRTYRF